jgi:hypothetical protein
LELGIDLRDFDEFATNRQINTFYTGYNKIYLFSIASRTSFQKSSLTFLTQHHAREVPSIDRESALQM